MSYQVIARKYRPQTFDDVVGQRAVTDTLKNAILHNRVAHGYIFSGARGVGKTTSARILAKALNCVNGPTVTPDGTCDSCRDIATGNSVDVIEIDAASNRGIDEIRELRETARYLPARDRYKVFIIDEAHMLTSEAFNALLKTLEEPPPRCVFILATTEAHKLPTTIQSRCQHFAFRLLEYSEVVSRLREVCAAEKIETDEGSLAVLAEAAAGSLRDALSLLDQVIAGCGEKLTEAEVQRLLGIVPAKFLGEMVEAIVAADPERVLGQVQRLASEGHEAAAFLGELTRFIRNLMIARSAGAASPLLEVPSDARASLERLSKALAEEDWVRFFQILLRAQSELRYALEPRFHLELALLKLVHARRLTSLEGLLAELKEFSKSSGSPSQKAEAAVKNVPPVAARTAAVAPRPASSSPAASAPSRQASPALSQTPGGYSQRPATSGAAPATSMAQPRPAAAPPALGLASGSTPTPVGAASRATPAAAPAPAPVTEAAAQDPRLSEVRKVLFDQSRKFVSSCLEHVTGWRFENGVAHFMYSKQNSGSFWADVLNSKENQQALQEACAQVLGQAVTIRVTLQDVETKQGSAVPEARERARNDALVKAFEQQFECVWLDVEDLRGKKP
ncbi:MAG TPA: DNA polymerase III subunit gamma/tau [Terriglobia bacterium]|nr:DNA polymerase III subunit gamma/tau [Terriglobia bacterium]